MITREISKPHDSIGASSYIVAQVPVKGIIYVIACMFVISLRKNASRCNDL